MFVDVFDAFIFGDGAVDGFVPVRRRASKTVATISQWGNFRSHGMTL